MHSPPDHPQSALLLNRDTLLGVALLSLSLLCATSSWAATEVAGVHGPWRLVAIPAEKVEIKADTLALKPDTSTPKPDSAVIDSLGSSLESALSEADSAATERVHPAIPATSTRPPLTPNLPTERLWEDSFGTRYLERLYDSAGTLWSRVELDPAAAAQDYSAAATDDPDSLENRAQNRSRGGRVPLIVYSTILGLAVDGPLLLMTTNPTSSRGAVGTYMLGAAAGIGLPLILTDEATTSQAQALLYWHGSTRMMIHGATVIDMMDQSASEQQIGASLLLWSVAGGVGGWHLGEGMSLGRAERIAAWSDISLVAGSILTPVRFHEDQIGGKELAQVVLPAHAAGLAYATLTSDNDDFTRGDAYASRAFGWVGLVTVPGLIVAGDVQAAEDNRGFLVATALTTLGGQLVGDRLVRDRHLSTTQGALVDASVRAGGLVGMGTGYLLTESGRAVAAFGLLGAYGGLLGSWIVLDQVRKWAPSATAGDFRLQLNPLALQAGLDGKSGASSAGTQALDSRGPRDSVPGAVQPFATMAWNW